MRPDLCLSVSRKIAVTFGLLAIAFGLAQVGAAGEPKRKITEAEARQLFDRYMGTMLSGYGTALIPLEGERKDLQLLKAKGLIAYRVVKLSPIQQVMLRTDAKDAVQLAFTEEGRHQSIPVRGKEEMARCFNFGSRVADRVASISDDGVVLIAGHETINEFGRSNDWSDTKARYKLLVSYDPFLEKFKFVEWHLSEWEEESWHGPQPYQEIVDGKQVCVYPK